MGTPIRQLYATNTNDPSGDILLSKYIPVKKEDGYHMPPDTPIGYDKFVPNVFDLKPEEGTVPIKVVQSEKETGIWLVCYDDYFGDEQHLYTHKPRFIEGTKNLDWEYEDDEENNFDISLHIASDIEMVAGDGPIPVTFVRGKY